MAVNRTHDTQRHVTVEVDSNDVAGPIQLDPHFAASYQLARLNGADGSVSVEITNDPDRTDWHEISSAAAEAHQELKPASAVRFTVSGYSSGTHRIHVFRIER